MDIHLLQLINDYMGDGKDDGKPDIEIDWLKFKKRLSDHGIPDHDVLAYWDNNYLAQTAIYENNQYRKIQE